MQRVVTVDAHPAVQVLRRVHDALSAVRSPELRDRDLGRGGQTLREPPDRLPCGEPDRPRCRCTRRPRAARPPGTSRSGDRTAHASWCTPRSCGRLPRRCRSRSRTARPSRARRVHARISAPLLGRAEDVGRGDLDALQRQARFGVVVRRVLALPRDTRPRSGRRWRRSPCRRPWSRARGPGRRAGRRERSPSSPSSTQPSPSGAAVVVGCSGSVPASVSAALRIVSPLATPGSSAACCASVPNSAIGSAPSTTVA